MKNSLKLFDIRYFNSRIKITINTLSRLEKFIKHLKHVSNKIEVLETLVITQNVSTVVKTKSLSSFIVKAEYMEYLSENQCHAVIYLHLFFKYLYT